MDFCSYLESIGYKPHRFINGQLLPLSNNGFFTTMMHGFLDIRFIKDGKTFIWGLHEHGKPPTLISPRPLMHLECDGYFLCPPPDDCINQLLQTEKPEDLYNSILNGKEYDFIKHPDSNITRKN